MYYFATGHSATYGHRVDRRHAHVANSTAMFLAIGLILVTFHLAHEDRLVRRIGLTALMGMCAVRDLAGPGPDDLAGPGRRRPGAPGLHARGASRHRALPGPGRAVHRARGAARADRRAGAGARHPRPGKQPSGQGQDESAVFREQAWGLMLDRWDLSQTFGRGFGQTVSFISNASERRRHQRPAQRVHLSAGRDGRGRPADLRPDPGRLRRARRSGRSDCPGAATWRSGPSPPGSSTWSTRSPGCCWDRRR